MLVDFTLPELDKALAWLEYAKKTVALHQDKFPKEEYNILLLELNFVKMYIEEEKREQQRREARQC